MKVLIIFDTKHGNTQKVAELIADGINSVEGNGTEVVNVKNFDLNENETYDLILIGSPNHGGRNTKSIKKFINNLSISTVKVNSFAVFDTYMKSDFEKAVKKMEKQINDDFPNSTLALPGLSIKVGGMKGPIVEEDLSKCKEYGIKLAKKG
ncbi:MAG TPA: flavodoxin family protein [Candidatus Nanopelagicaceae bacterium]|nr:flavodoxin family protein [Candidatus Nanopelagicaceae bacterium]